MTVHLYNVEAGEFAQQMQQQTEPHLIKDIGALIDDPGKFLQCTIDCASEVLGVDTAAKAGVAASGAPVLPKRFVTKGASKGTSPASIASRKMFGNTRLPFKAPAPTLKNGLQFSNKLGTVAGRGFPILGTASLFPDARALDQCVATCARPGQ